MTTGATKCPLQQLHRLVCFDIFGGPFSRKAFEVARLAEPRASRGASGTGPALIESIRRGSRKRRYAAGTAPKPSSSIGP